MGIELQGKRILVVDDERDVCEMVVDQLDRCTVDTADSYEAGKDKLAKNQYDVVVLDIMGVRGHDLLHEFASVAPTIMLTAHALTPQDLRKSIQGHAVLYLPKQELGHIDEYIAKALEAKEAKAPLWSWLFKRLDFTRWFGAEWTIGEIDFKLSEEEVSKDLSDWR